MRGFAIPHACVDPSLTEISSPQERRHLTPQLNPWTYLSSPHDVGIRGERMAWRPSRPPTARLSRCALLGCGKGGSGRCNACCSQGGRLGATLGSWPFLPLPWYSSANVAASRRWFKRPWRLTLSSMCFRRLCVLRKVASCAETVRWCSRRCCRPCRRRRR